MRRPSRFAPWRLRPTSVAMESRPTVGPRARPQRRNAPPRVSWRASARAARGGVARREDAPRDDDGMQTASGRTRFGTPLDPRRAGASPSRWPRAFRAICHGCLSSQERDAMASQATALVATCATLVAPREWEGGRETMLRWMRFYGSLVFGGALLVFTGVAGFRAIRFLR